MDRKERLENFFFDFLDQGFDDIEAEEKARELEEKWSEDHGTAYQLGNHLNLACVCRFVLVGYQRQQEKINGVSLA